MDAKPGYPLSPTPGAAHTARMLRDRERALAALGLEAPRDRALEAPRDRALGLVDKAPRDRERALAALGLGLLEP